MALALGQKRGRAGLVLAGLLGLLSLPGCEAAASKADGDDAATATDAVADTQEPQDATADAAESKDLVTGLDVATDNDTAADVPAPATPTWLITPAGGTAWGAQGEAFLDVPKGAVTADVAVTVVAVAKPAVEVERASAVVDVGPNGQKFAVPVTLCLKADSEAMLKAGQACLGYLDEASGKWRCEDPCLKQVSPSYVCGKTNHLTNFAILLGGMGGNDKCNDDKVIGPSGGVVTSIDGAASVKVLAGALTTDTPVTVTNVPKPVVDTKRASDVYDFTPNGTKFVHSATICLKPTVALGKGDAPCLGYLDETAKPPVWNCEDSCLNTVNGSLCGETGHFTNFAILLGGGGDGSGCDKGTYITASKGGLAKSPDGTATVEFLADALAQDTTIQVESVAGIKLPASTSNAYDFSPSGLTFAAPATICLKPASGGLSSKEMCLASLDNTANPPAWKCEDKCLKDTGGMVCGKTTHFSRYALVAGPGCGN